MNIFGRFLVVKIVITFCKVIIKLIGTCTYQMYVPFVHISTQSYIVVYRTLYLVYVIILS